MKFSHHLSSKQTHPFQMFPAEVETISLFFSPLLDFARSLPPCLPLASLSSQEELVQWSFDVKIIEGADPCNGGNKKKKKRKEKKSYEISKIRATRQHASFVFLSLNSLPLLSVSLQEVAGSLGLRGTD